MMQMVLFVMSYHIEGLVQGYANSYVFSSISIVLQ